MAFAPIALFKHGNPLMVDYTPGVAVVAGSVVVIGNVCRICHNPIPANVLGALAAHGGVYQLPKSTAGSSAIADGTKVYWDATNQVITTSAASGANKQIGFTVKPSVDADTTQWVQHLPG